MAMSIVAADLGLCEDGERIWVTSNVVAEKFGKQHKDVLRAIRELDCSAEFHQRNFAPMLVDVEVGNGAVRQSPAYRMTRDGFTFLVMGFTGQEAAAWKERYIEAFNMAEAGQKRSIGGLQEILAGVVELLKDSREAHNRVESAVAITKQEVTDLRADVTQISDTQKRDKEELRAEIIDIKTRMRQRVHPSGKTRGALFYTLERRGWRCPCCEEPKAPEDFEVDHFFDVGRASVADLWAICKPCHKDLTGGRIERQDVRSMFHAFHEFRRRAEPQQRLF